MPKKRSLVQINYIFLFILFIGLLFLGALYFLLALPRCSVTQPFMCFGHEVEGKRVHIYLKNNLANNMEVTLKLDNCKNIASGIISTSEVKGFTLTNCDFKFLYKNELIINYRILGTNGISHSFAGFISGAKGINL